MANAGPDVVLRVAVAIIIHHLRVSDWHVIGLDEGLHTKFPIARHDLGDVDGFVAILEREILKVLRQDFKVVLKRLTIRIQIDKDEASPHANFGFRQTEFPLVDLREIPFARQHL